MVGSPKARIVITATIAAEIARTCVIEFFSLNTKEANIEPSRLVEVYG